jgi:tetratricopeptide (TPR) repeat protein
MKSHIRVFFGLTVCMLGIMVISCPTGGGGGGDPFDPANPTNPTNPANPVDVQTALNNGNDSLAAKNYDKAIEHYREAYNADNNNPDAIAYSVLAELAAISIDPKVRSLVKDRLGVEGYPATMGALFTTDWMKDYTDERLVDGYFDAGSSRWAWWYEAWTDGAGYHQAGYYYWDGIYTFVSSNKRYETTSNRFPGLALPGWFSSTTAYTGSLTNLVSGGTVQSTTTLPLLLAANLLDKNTTGLNTLFAEVLDSVFGGKFEDTAARVNNLNAGAMITLDAGVISALGLEDLLEGGSLQIGKPELDTLIAAIRIVKATFEWIASYDWNSDFSFLKFDWSDYNAFETAISGTNVNNLPFKNTFLNSQDSAMLNKSKADYLTALSTISGVYDVIGDRDYIPPGVRDELNNYRWIKDGVDKLHAAIQGNGTFWIPKDMPSGQTWTAVDGNAMLGVDMAKLFAPGYLMLNDLVEVDSAKRPVFYKFTEASNSWTKINAESEITSSDAYGFKISLSKVKALVRKAFDDSGDTIQVVLFPAEIAKPIYKKYYP